MSMESDDPVDAQAMVDAADRRASWAPASTLTRSERSSSPTGAAAVPTR